MNKKYIELDKQTRQNAIELPIQHKQRARPRTKYSTILTHTHKIDSRTDKVRT